MPFQTVTGCNRFTASVFPKGMSEIAMSFRNRARDCRALAQRARHPADRSMLQEIADKLVEEADKIDEEEAEHCSEKSTGG